MIKLSVQIAAKHQANSSDCEIYMKVATRNNLNNNKQFSPMSDVQNKRLNNDNFQASDLFNNHQPKISSSQAARNNNNAQNSNVDNQSSNTSVWNDIQMLLKIINISKIKNVNKQNCKQNKRL